MVNNGFTGNPIAAHETISDLTTVATSTRPQPADQAMLQAGANPVRYTIDGTDPTASHGFRLAANEYRVIDVGLCTAIKALNESGASTLQIQYLNLIPSKR